MPSPQASSPLYSESPDVAQPPRTQQKTIPELLQGIVSNLQDMMRGEFRLARAEVRPRSCQSRTCGRIAALYGAGFLLLAAVYGLATVFENWFAALLLGMILTGGAAALIGTALSQFHRVNPVPHQTIRTLEENAQFEKDRIKRTRNSRNSQRATPHVQCPGRRAEVLCGLADTI